MKKKNDREAKILYEYLKDNPYASYDDMTKLFAEDVKVNSLLVKLKRMGCIKMIRQRDVQGKTTTSYKECIKSPDEV